MSEEMVILGSGPAGYTAALYAARADLAPVLVEGMQPGGQLTTTTDIENFPGFPGKISGPELTQLMREQAEKFGTKILKGEAVGVDFSAAPLRVFLDEDRSLESKTVIIAAGASALYLGLESEQKLIGRGVSGCAVCDGAFYRNEPVAVVGGGDTAMEDALFMTRFASRVTVIHRRDEFRASRIMADRVKAHPKIEILWDSVVSDVLDPDKGEVIGARVRNVKTGAEAELEINGLFVAIGHKPNTGIFTGHVGMDPRGYIVCDNTRTDRPGVFAAGDVQDPIYRQAITAAGTGCMAALEAERFLKEHE